ncbi:MAG: hypothetical protein RL375_4094 [Pseudomonadota bacterium]
MFDEIAASRLIKVDAQCHQLSERTRPVNPGRLRDPPRPARGASRRGMCAAHPHGGGGHGVAQRGGVLPISPPSTFVLASLAYHDHESVAFRPDESSRLRQLNRIDTNWRD